MDDDMDTVVTTGGTKRSRTEGGTSAGSAAGGAVAGDPCKDILGNLPKTLGEGEHERSIMEGILVALRDLSMDVQDLKGAMYMSWETDRDTPYIAEGMKMKEQYTEDCRKVRGQGVSLGHVKNYCMLGIFVAAKKDPNITEEQKQKLEELMGKHLRNGQGRLSTDNVLGIAHLVAYCQVVRTKKKGFINILMREGAGKECMEILARALDWAGKRQWDSTVPKPIFKEIKDALGQARKGAGKGKGRGKKED